jgi:hypothetical protein
MGVVYTVILRLKRFELLQNTMIQDCFSYFVNECPYPYGIIPK